MHVLLVGGGGREHALAWRISQSPLLRRLSTTEPNPGVLALGAELATGDPVAWARAQGVDLVVVGPEGPLAAGLVDRLAAAGIPAFGPSQAAAQLEASKAFARRFMDEHGIPGPRWSTHEEAATAHAAVEAMGTCVVKADGLAAGKGVIVADSAEQAHAAVDEVLGGRFGGARVVLEERLFGPELSVLALCDGQRALPLMPARDHKRRYDRDQGPNTGGMGAVCPPAGLDPALVEQVRREVLQPTVDGMRARGTPFRGLLYAGIMLTPTGPRVLEFNTRFGDPECQPLMRMLDEDLLPLLLSCAVGSLPERPLRWRSGVACCLVVVNGPYPEKGPAGMPIEGLEEADRVEDVVVFQAGTALVDGRVVVNGGRVLGITATGADLTQARRSAYAAAALVRFPGADLRSDIGVTE